MWELDQKESWGLNNWCLWTVVLEKAQESLGSCCCSAPKLWVTLCDTMDCSSPGSPVLHCLPEFAQTNGHWVDDAIQPSHPQVTPFSSCPQSFLASGCFQMSQLFASVLPMNTQDWSPCSPRDSQESSPTPQFKSINSLALSFLYSPTITFIHDYWKNHSFD